MKIRIFKVGLLYHKMQYIPISKVEQCYVVIQLQIQSDSVLGILLVARK